MTKSFEERFNKEFPSGKNEGGEYELIGRVFTTEIKNFIRTELQKAREEEKEKLPEILTKYSEYLSEHGYMDSDWYCEEPNTVEDFLKDKPRR